MDNKLIGEQITRYRKERGLTQEELGRAAGVSTQAVSRWENGGAPDVALLPAIADKLGVTIDALFGRESGERVDIHDVVARWAKGLPKEQRLDRFCRLCWSLLIGGGLTEVELPKIEYPVHAEFSGEPEDNRLLLSQFRMESGLVMDLHAEEFSFVTIWPEPEAGYDAYLAPKSEYRKLFQLLARPGCLELIEYMCSGGIYESLRQPGQLHRRHPPVLGRPQGRRRAGGEAGGGYRGERWTLRRGHPSRAGRRHHFGPRDLRLQAG